MTKVTPQENSIGGCPHEQVKFDLQVVRDETQGFYVYCLHLPGIHKEELRVSHRKELNQIHVLDKTKDDKLLMSIEIPEGVDTEEISASMRNKILSIKIKKIVKPRPQLPPVVDAELCPVEDVGKGGKSTQQHSTRRDCGVGPEQVAKSNQKEKQEGGEEAANPREVQDDDKKLQHNRDGLSRDANSAEGNEKMSAATSDKPLQEERSNDEKHEMNDNISARTIPDVDRNKPEDIVGEKREQGEETKVLGKCVELGHDNSESKKISSLTPQWRKPELVDQKQDRPSSFGLRVMELRKTIRNAPLHGNVDRRLFVGVGAAGLLLIVGIVVWRFHGIKTEPVKPLKK